MKQFVLSFLKKNNYPLIHGMDHNEILTILHYSNRSALIVWALKLLNDDCIGALEGREDDINFLGNILVTFGFCKENQVTSFFNSNMSAEHEVTILYKLFDFVDQSSELCNDVTDIRLSVPEVKDLTITKKLKTHQEKYKYVRTLSENDRITMLQKIQKEKIDENIAGENVTAKGIVGDIFNLDDLQHSLQKFKVTVDILKNQNETDSSYSIEPDNKDVVLECNEKLHIISEYINDLKVIKECVSSNDIQLSNDIAPSLIEMLATDIMTAAT